MFSIKKTMILRSSVLRRKIENVHNINIQNFWSRSRKNIPPECKSIPGKTFSIVKPQVVSPKLSSDEIPASVTPPSYFITGQPGPSPSNPEVKIPDAIEKMRAACKLARCVLNEAIRMVKPGIATDEIDKLVTQLSFDAGAYPSPLNYRGFPKSVCTSVNNVVCHGIPDSRPLELGDIINIDITVFLDGHHGDCSETFLVAGKSERNQENFAGAIRLLNVAKQALYVGIDQCGPGKRFSAIGGSIEKYVSGQGYRVIPAFTGHGIGEYFHGPPDIYPCRNSYPGVMLPGMTFTVEPGVSEGSPNVMILDDGWTAVSPDNSRSAQFEHTVLITETGVEILTKDTSEEHDDR